VRARPSSALTAVEGDYAAARTRLEESLTTFRAVGDKRMVWAGLMFLGLATFLQGDSARARSRYEGALAVAREMGDRAAVAFTLTGLGDALVASGDRAAAQAAFAAQRPSLSLLRLDARSHCLRLDVLHDTSLGIEICVSC